MSKKTIAFWLAYVTFVKVFYPDANRILAIGIGLIISAVSNLVDRILYDSKGYW